ANTGTRSGATVVQLYLGLPEESTPRPLRELKGFQRVELKAGEKRTVVISLPQASLLYWHPVQNQWVRPEGSLKVELGLSERHIRQSATLPPLAHALPLQLNPNPSPDAKPMAEL
ncbi:MAG: fibronectin type III-like domain-contianing protein, partial [Verrucomicrobia bacterium]|nr:fibronectin type III-like domain-contianing protein [Verrucomicrobiota bacterium]